MNGFRYGLKIGESQTLSRADHEAHSLTGRAVVHLKILSVAVSLTIAASVFGIELGHSTATEGPSTNLGNRWHEGFGLVDLSGDAQAFAVYDDGNGEALYVGGAFTTAGDAPAENVAKWDGSSWSALVGPFGNGTNGKVTALATYNDGSGEALYVGGKFTTAGGVTAYNIAKWDGFSWSALTRGGHNGVSGGTNDPVCALAVFDYGSGDALFVGGNFVSAGGKVANHVAKWDRFGWSTLRGDSETGTSGPVNALAAYDDGGGPALYAGGDFSTAGGIPVNEIAKWDGDDWSALTGPSGYGVSGRWVGALAVFDDNNQEALYVGGYFSEAGGIRSPGVARWDGSAWSAVMGPAGEWVGRVYSLAAYDDGHGEALYAGGDFPDVGDREVNNIAKWDGLTWSTLQGPSGTGTNDSVGSLAAFDDGNAQVLVAGGEFTTAGGVAANGIASWDGAVWSSFGQPAGHGMNNRVLSFVSYDDGGGDELYAGGFFTSASGAPMHYIARWDGSSWSAVPGSSGEEWSEHVAALAVFDDGTGEALYAGYNYTRVSKWDGVSWSVLPGPIYSYHTGWFNWTSFSALAVYDDGTGEALYVGGWFSRIGAVDASSIARWDGVTWSRLEGSLWGGYCGYAEVSALAVYDDGTGPALYAGGEFTIADGVTVNNIAKWDGSTWSALVGPSGVGLSGSVHALAVYDEGSGPALFAGGTFTIAGGDTVNHVARWNGTSWSALSGDSGVGVDGNVFALTAIPYGNGEALIVGGDFSHAGGLAANRIARWDGISWFSLSEPLANGMNNRVRALAVHDDGNGTALFAGGRFTTAGGIASTFIAKWSAREENAPATPDEIFRD